MQPLVTFSSVEAVWSYYPK